MISIPRKCFQYGALGERPISTSKIRKMLKWALSDKTSIQKCEAALYRRSEFIITEDNIDYVFDSNGFRNVCNVCKLVSDEILAQLEVENEFITFMSELTGIYPNSFFKGWLVSTDIRKIVDDVISRDWRMGICGYPNQHIYSLKLYHTAIKHNDLRSWEFFSCNAIGKMIAWRRREQRRHAKDYGSVRSGFDNVVDRAYFSYDGTVEAMTRKISFYRMLDITRLAQRVPLFNGLLTLADFSLERRSSVSVRFTYYKSTHSFKPQVPGREDDFHICVRVNDNNYRGKHQIFWYTTLAHLLFWM